MAKSIFARAVFSMEKSGYFHVSAKTCQPWLTDLVTMCTCKDRAKLLESEKNQRVVCERLNEACAFQIII